MAFQSREPVNTGILFIQIPVPGKGIRLGGRPEERISFKALKIPVGVAVSAGQSSEAAGVTAVSAGNPARSGF